MRLAFSWYNEDELAESTKRLATAIAKAKAMWFYLFLQFFQTCDEGYSELGLVWYNHSGSDTSQMYSIHNLQYLSMEKQNTYEKK